MTRPPQGAPGLPVERTALAWQRTALSVGLLSIALLAHLAWTERPLVAQVFSAVLAAAAACSSLTAAVLAARAKPDGLAPFWRLVTLVLATLLVGAATVVAAAVHALTG